MSEAHSPSHPLAWFLAVVFVAWVSVRIDAKRPRAPLEWVQYLAGFGAVCWAVTVIASLPRSSVL